MLVVGGIGILIAGRDTGSVTEAEQVAAVLARSDARIITLKGEDRAPLKLVWSPSRGEGALLADDLAAIDDTETYELWAIADGEPAQVTLFRPDERGWCGRTSPPTCAVPTRWGSPSSRPAGPTPPPPRSC